MPEGHVTHRLASGLTERFAGAPTRSTSPQGRFAGEAADIDGHPLEVAEAYGKNLFVHFGDRAVHVHLGLAGRLSFGEDDARPVLGQIRWRLENDRHYADLRGPQSCRLVDEAGIAAITDLLGPDPLRDDAEPAAGWERIRVSATPIGLLLMDQRVAAGVGNIFRAEVLYRHRIDPMMQGRLLRRSEWNAIWVDLVGLMHYAVLHGRIDTVRPEHDPVAMGRAPRVDRHGGEVYVYRRAAQRCLVCGTRVRTRELGGRNLFWCPTCQRTSRRRVPAGRQASAPSRASTASAAPTVPRLAATRETAVRTDGQRTPSSRTDVR